MKSRIPDVSRQCARESDKVVSKKFDRFRRLVWAYYREHGRSAKDLPWRGTRDPYRILVSEFMLQQTQVERVKTKYAAFLKSCPTLRSLASASQTDVIAAWLGLGYNRRARNLLLCAREVMERHGGKIPRTETELLALPGIGQSTAGAVLAFAFGLPSVFIETNIRSAFIHFFFSRKQKVSDREIIPLLEATVDRNNPREWYYALFDYGVHLKIRDPAIGTRSSHFKKQSPFKGSRREVRGAILKLLAAEKSMTGAAIAKRLGKERELTTGVLEELCRDGLLEKQAGRYAISGSF
jgi:A/G-specific adenine glycosylase